MPINFILLYATTVFIASIIPGPSMLLALTHGMKFGARRSIASAMGNLTVTIIQAIISIAGLGTILIASEMTFQIIKFAGAAYLVYIGISIIISPKMSFSPSSENQIQRKVSLGRMFSQAALVTAGNPKAIIFFTAIFPQFIDPYAGYIQQSCLLIGIVSIIAFSCFMLYAICGQKIVCVFSKESIGKYITKIIGGTFISAGIGLAVSNK
jgi:threonine/homoserine/homoserine lactone efflux protein